MLTINELYANKKGIILYCDYYGEDIARKLDWDNVIDDCLAVIYSKKTNLDEEKCFDYLYELLEKDPYELVDMAYDYQIEIAEYYEEHEEKII